MLLTNQSVKTQCPANLSLPPAPAAASSTAACDEFGARGFAATTVDRIARRARVNKAMIYYHFPNKRALYTAIVRELYAIAPRTAARPSPPSR